MSEATAKIEWESTALNKYNLMISKIPIFHRNIAKIVVDKKAVINAQKRGTNQVEDADIVSAFFTEVPKTFYSLMIRLLDEVGLDYKLYKEKK